MCHLGGYERVKVNENHPSIIEINNKYEYESMSKLDFQPITVTEDRWYMFATC
jgi:hypothetical protein